MDDNKVLPPKVAVQSEVKIKDFVIGTVKYREIELTPDILPLFDRVNCDDVMHLDDSDSDSCRAKKNVLIGLAGGYWRLFHRDSADENKLKGSVKLLATAPEGVDMQKLAFEDRRVAEVEVSRLQYEAILKEAEKFGSLKDPQQLSVRGRSPGEYSQPAHQASVQKSAQAQATRQRQMQLEAQQQQIHPPYSLVELNKALLNCRDETSKQTLMDRIQHVVSTTQDAAPAMAQTPQYLATQVQPEFNAERPSSHDPAIFHRLASTDQSTETHSNASTHMSGYVPKINPPPFFSPVLPASPIGVPLSLGTYASGMPPQFPRQYGMPCGWPTPRSANGGDSAFGSPSSLTSYHQLMQRSLHYGGLPTMPAPAPSPPSTFLDDPSPYMSPAQFLPPLTTVIRRHPSDISPRTPPTQEQIDASWADAKTREGKTYYYNKLTRVTQWERPQRFKEPSLSSPAQKMQPVDILPSKATACYQAGRPYLPNLSDVKKTEAVLNQSIAPDNNITTDDMPIRTKSAKGALTNVEMIKMAREVASEQNKKMEESKKHMLAMMQKQGHLSGETKLDAEKKKLPSADMAKLANLLLRKEVAAKEEQATKDEMKVPKVKEAVQGRLKKLKAEQLAALKKVQRDKELADWEMVGDEELDDDYVFA